MSEQNPGEYRELTDAIKDLVPLLARVANGERHPPPVAGANTATISINAGGIASIASCTIAAVCMIVMIALAFQQQKTDTRQDADIRDQRADQRRADDYRNLLYRNYPELRPEILKKHEAENH